MAHRRNETAPVCPRCGYDQTGIMATWAGQGHCPLAGRCAECGLEFEWVDVVRPERHLLPWFFEHRRGWWCGGLAAWRTLGRAMYPRGFWRTVRVEMPVRPWRAVWWVVAFVGLLHGAGAMSSCASVFLHTWGGARRVGALEWVNSALMPFAWVWRSPSGLLVHWGVLSFPYALLAPMVVLPLVPAMLLVLTRTRATSRVRAAHVVRSGCYQAAVLLPLWAVVVVEIVVFRMAQWWILPRSAWHYFITRLLFDEYTIVTASVIGAWYAWYWYEAITRGLRLPRGMLVWALLMVAAALLWLIIALQDDAFVGLWI